MTEYTLGHRIALIDDHLHDFRAGAEDIYKSYKADN